MPARRQLNAIASLPERTSWAGRAHPHPTAEHRTAPTELLHARHPSPAARHPCHLCREEAEKMTFEV